ncbi:hypothetical protein [Caballeronia sordidicola]|uniref:hypothetical protein n=1 Tax=Caballeronia sordidicola TaxID=196367 RepID=UPI00076486F9|nr:hypothetical protein [Caballeronia sordidicola]
MSEKQRLLDFRTSFARNQIADMTDRVLCFVEDVIAHSIQKRLAQGITLTEIPVAQRAPEMPLRFQNTITGSGLPMWQIRYHVSRFDET